jgi:cobalt-zinc-cadmium efflux system outer membrane protein
MIVGLGSVAGSSSFVRAQFVASSLPAKAPLKLTLNQFIRSVAANNIELAAQRYNVSIAQAQIIAARVSPNPVATFAGTRDVSDKEQPSTESGGLSETIEIGGKRHFRVSIAIQNLLTASSTLDDFFRTLRGTAASAFVDAVASGMVVQQKRKAFESLNRLAELNRIRFEEGDIAEVDYNQALVDSLQAQGDLSSAEATASTALLALLQLLGNSSAPLPRPSSDLGISERKFDLQALLYRALKSRPDIAAARSTHVSALASIGLARANRLPDFTLNAGLQQTGSGTNPINPSPNFNSLNFGFSVPIPVFNSFRGEYLVAVNTAMQSQKTLRSVELKAEVDVRQNFERFRLAKERASKYEGPVLDLAAKVLDARLAAYKTGGATLLDVLAAQRADTDVRLASIDALSERAKALIALEQAANIWDIDF